MMTPNDARTRAAEARSALEAAKATFAKDPSDEARRHAHECAAALRDAELDAELAEGRERQLTAERVAVQRAEYAKEHAQLVQRADIGGALKLAASCAADFAIDFAEAERALARVVAVVVNQRNEAGYANNYAVGAELAVAKVSAAPNDLERELVRAALVASKVGETLTAFMQSEAATRIAAVARSEAGRGRADALDRALLGEGLRVRTEDVAIPDMAMPPRVDDEVFDLACKALAQHWTAAAPQKESA